MKSVSRPAQVLCKQTSYVTLLLLLLTRSGHSVSFCICMYVEKISSLFERDSLSLTPPLIQFQVVVFLENQSRGFWLLS